MFHPWLLPLLVLAILAGFSVSATAQDEIESPWMPEPAVVVTSAGVDRFLEDAHHLLATAGLPDVSARLDGWMILLNELQGIDRGQPLGLMLFFSTDLQQSEPAPLVFVSLTSLDELRETASRTGNSLRDADEPGKYLLRLGEDELLLDVREKLVFISRPHEASFLLTKDIIPSLAAEPLDQADVSFRILFDGIPKPFFEQAFHNIEASNAQHLDLQPNETEGARAVRVAAMQHTLDLFKLMMRGTRELRFRGTLRADADGGDFSLDVIARPDHPYATWLSQVLTRDAAPFPSEDIPLGLSLAIRLTDSGSHFTQRVLEVAESDAAPSLNELPVEVQEAIQSLQRSFRSTLESRLLGASVQFQSADSGHFVLLGEALAREASAMDQVLRVFLETAAADQSIQSFELDHATVDDVRIHRFRGNTLRPRDAQVYGDQPQVYLASGEDRLWFAFGEGAASTRLQQWIRSGTKRTPAKGDSESDLESTTEREPSDSFLEVPATVRFHLRVEPWVKLLVSRRSGDSSLRQLMESAFPQEQSRDRFQAVLIPTDTGASFRVRFEEGYVRLLSRAVAKRVQSR